MSPLIIALIPILLVILLVLVVAVARMDARISRLEWDRFGSLAKHSKQLRGGKAL